MKTTQSSGPTNSSNQTSKTPSKNEAEKTAKAVKNAAKTLREAAISTREAVKAVSDSGVVIELAGSIQAAAKAARDTVQGVSDTSKDLHESQTAPKLGSAILQTLSLVEETEDIASQTTAQVPKTAPRMKGTSSKAAKRKKKEGGLNATKNVRKRLTTDKNKAQTEVKGLE
jgi:hypothetical protein